MAGLLDVKNPSTSPSGKAIHQRFFFSPYFLVLFKILVSFSISNKLFYPQFVDSYITLNVNRNGINGDRSHIIKEDKKARKIKVDDRKNVSTLKTICRLEYDDGKSRYHFFIGRHSRVFKKIELRLDKVKIFMVTRNVSLRHSIKK